MKSFFKEFFGGSRSGDDNQEDSSTDLKQVSEWTKADFLEYIHSKELGENILESVKESDYFDQIKDYTKLNFSDLLVILTNNDASVVLNSLAQDYPTIFKPIKKYDSYLHTSNSVSVIRHSGMDKANMFDNYEGNHIEDGNVVNQQEQEQPSSIPEEQQAEQN